MKQYTNQHRTSTAVVAVLIAASAVAGCSPRSAELATDVVWPQGPPEADIDADPAAVAVREYELVVAAANNARDYRGAALTEVMRPDIAASLAQDLRDRIARDDARPYLGPRALSITEISEDSDAGVLLVAACGQHRQQGPGETNDGLRGLQYTLEPHDDGLRVVQASWGPDCDTAGVVSVFEPPPDLDGWDDLTPDDVRSP